MQITDANWRLNKKMNSIKIKTNTPTRQQGGSRPRSAADGDQYEPPIQTFVKNSSTTNNNIIKLINKGGYVNLNLFITSKHSIIISKYHDQSIKVSFYLPGLNNL